MERLTSLAHGSGDVATGGFDARQSSKRRVSVGWNYVGHSRPACSLPDHCAD
jgi:hypothetical protein